jgi:class 3 adenylate cyclase
MYTELAPGPVQRAAARVLATVLFTDIVDATAEAVRLGDRGWVELLRRHHALVRRLLALHGGRELDAAGDGFFAVFDVPSRALTCACAIGDEVAALGLRMRAGIHAGECEHIDGKLTGVAVHLGARIAAAAAPGEVLVSATVKELVAGSGRRFTERGDRHLKGLPEPARLYAARAAHPLPSSSMPHRLRPAPR